MKKIIFYLSAIVLLYLIYIILNIFLYHYDNLNNYGNGFLVGKALLAHVFAYIMYRTNPFVADKNTN